MIREFSVESYGQFRNFQVKELSQGLNIVLGPNEAGKTTLVRFLNHVLFGQKHAEPVFTPLGGQEGGRILMEDDVLIERLGRKLQAHGRIRSQDDIRDLLVDRSIFESVFSFNLDLLNFSNLEGTQAFSGALVDSYSSYELAKKHVQNAKERLWRQRAESQIGNLEEELQGVRERIKRLEQENDLFAEKRATLDAFDLDSDRLRYHEEEFRVALNYQENLIKAYPHWVEYRQYQSEVGELPHLAAVTPSDREELVELRRAISEFKERLEDSTFMLNARREGLAKIQFNKDLLSHKSQVLELSRRLSAVPVSQLLLLRQEEVLRQSALDELLRDFANPEHADATFTTLERQQIAEKAERAIQALEWQRQVNGVVECLDESELALSKARDTRDSHKFDQRWIDFVPTYDRLSNKIATYHGWLGELDWRKVDIEYFEQKIKAAPPQTPELGAPEELLNDFQQDVHEVEAGLGRATQIRHEMTADERAIEDIVERLGRGYTQEVLTKLDIAPATYSEIKEAGILLSGATDGLKTAQEELARLQDPSDVPRDIEAQLKAIKERYARLRALEADVREASTPTNAGAAAYEPPESALKTFKAICFVLIFGGLCVAGIGAATGQAWTIAAGVVLMLGGFGLFLALKLLKAPEVAVGRPKALVEALSVEGFEGAASVADVILEVERAQTRIRELEVEHERLERVRNLQRLVGEKERAHEEASRAWVRALAGAGFSSAERINTHEFAEVYPQWQLFAERRSALSRKSAEYDELSHAAKDFFARMAPLEDALNLSGVAETSPPEQRCAQLKRACDVWLQRKMEAGADLKIWEGDMKRVREKLVDAYSKVEELEQNIAGYKRLLAELSSLGFQPNTSSLIYAEDIMTGEEEEQKAWNEANLHVEELERTASEERRKLAALEKTRVPHEEALTAWGAVGQESPALDIAPQHAGQVLSQLAEVTRKRRDRDEVRARLETMNDVRQAILKEASELAPRVGLGEVDLEKWLQDAPDSINVEAQKASEHAAALKVLNEAEGELQRIELHHERKSSEMAQKLNALGFAKIDAALEAAEVWCKREELEQRVQHRELTLRTIFGSEWGSARISEDLQTGEVDGWKAQMQMVEMDLNEVLKSIDSNREGLGRARAEIERLQQSGDLADLRFDECVLSESLRRKRHEFAEILIAGQLLEEALQTYKDEHQPSVFAKANAFMDLATVGKYERLVVDNLRDKNEIFVQDKSGTRRAENQLSRGTRDLIFIVLRLSLALDYAERNRSLPLIMDDIMVNLDEERAEAVAKLIAEVSKHVQIFVFTSREDTQHRLARYAERPKTITLER